MIAIGIRTFFDTDVLLDVVLRREPYVEHSAQALLMAEHRMAHGHTSAPVLANVFSIVSRITTPRAAISAVNDLRLVLDVLPLGQNEVDAALSRFEQHPAWEDQLQYAAAVASGVELLITRNLTDFPTSPVLPLTPTEFLLRMADQPARVDQPAR